MLEITTDIKCSATKEVGTPVMIADRYGYYEIVPYNNELLKETKVYVELGVIKRINKNSIVIVVHSFSEQ